MDAIIDFKRGWACSNDVDINIDRELIVVEGERRSKHTTTIRAMGYLCVYGQLLLGDEVEVVCKDDEGNKKGYAATVTGMTPEMLILTKKAQIENYRDIIKKIKGGNNYGK